MCEQNKVKHNDSTHSIYDGQTWNIQHTNRLTKQLYHISLELLACGFHPTITLSLLHYITIMLLIKDISAQMTG